MSTALVPFEKEGNEGKQLSATSETRSKFNEHYVKKSVARAELRRYIKDNPGRFTAVDLSGITGVSVGRINRLLSFDAEFSRYAKRGLVAVPATGGRPSWFNVNTPIVSQSFWRGAFAQTAFRVQGDIEARMQAQEIDSSVRDLLASSKRAPHVLMQMQGEIRDKIADQADALTISKQQTERLRQQLEISEKTRQQLEDRSGNLPKTKKKGVSK